MRPVFLHHKKMQTLPSAPKFHPKITLPRHVTPKPSKSGTHTLIPPPLQYFAGQVECAVTQPVRVVKPLPERIFSILPCSVWMRTPPRIEEFLPIRIKLSYVFLHFLSQTHIILSPNTKMFGSCVWTGQKLPNMQTGKCLGRSILDSHGTGNNRGENVWTGGGR